MYNINLFLNKLKNLFALLFIQFFSLNVMLLLTMSSDESSNNNKFANSANHLLKNGASNSRNKSTRRRNKAGICGAKQPAVR